MRNIARRVAQESSELARESSDPSAWQNVGGIDDEGNWRAAGISNVTSTGDPFYSGG